MLRSILKVVCIVSAGICSFCVGFLTVSAVKFFQAAEHVGTSIIGGADGPTAVLLVQQILRAPITGIAGLFLLLCAASGLALLFTKK